MSKPGYIVLSRSIVERPAYKRLDAAGHGVWQRMLIETNWGDTTEITESGQIINVHAGQFCKSLKQISELCGVKKGKAERVVKTLLACGECKPILHKSAGNFRVLEWSNWDDFQGGNGEKGSGKGRGKGSGKGQHEKKTMNTEIFSCENGEAGKGAGKGSDEKQESLLKQENTKEENEETYIPIFEHWNSKTNVTKCRKFDGAVKNRIVSAMNGRMKEGFSVKDVIGAIDNLDAVVGSEAHYYSYRWNLPDFLSKPNGVHKFVDDARPLENFKNSRGSVGHGRSGCKPDPRIIPEGMDYESMNRG